MNLSLINEVQRRHDHLVISKKQLSLYSEPRQTTWHTVQITCSTTLTRLNTECSHKCSFSFPRIGRGCHLAGIAGIKSYAQSTTGSIDNDRSDTRIKFGFLLNNHTFIASGVAGVAVSYNGAIGFCRLFPWKVEACECINTQSETTGRTGNCGQVIVKFLPHLSVWNDTIVSSLIQPELGRKTTIII